MSEVRLSTYKMLGKVCLLRFDLFFIVFPVKPQLMKISITLEFAFR